MLLTKFGVAFFGVGEFSRRDSSGDSVRVSNAALTQTAVEMAVVVTIAVAVTVTVAVVVTVAVESDLAVVMVVGAVIEFGVALVRQENGLSKVIGADLATDVTAGAAAASRRAESFGSKLSLKSEISISKIKT